MFRNRFPLFLLVLPLLAAVAWLCAPPPAEAAGGTWHCAQNCCDIGKAIDALNCTWPQHSGDVSCNVQDSGIGTCSSYGNNVSCQPHDTDQFVCGAGAILSCPAGTLKRGGDCFAVEEIAVKSCCVDVGNPVDALTGRKHEEVLDWTSAGPFPLEFRRFYSSSTALLRAPTYSRLATGWRSNFDAAASWRNGLGSVVETAEAAATIHIALPDGFEYAFKKQGGVWRPVLPRPHGSSSTIVYWDRFRSDIDLTLSVDATGATLQVEDGRRYRFDAEGRLVRIAFPGGYAQTLTYDGGYNTRVTDSFGRWLDFVYAGDAGRPVLLSELVTSGGQRFTFSYQSRHVGHEDVAHDSFWALLGVTMPDDTPATDADNPKQTYEYLNDAERPFLLTGIVDERGVRHARWTYDEKGRALTSEHAGGTDRYSFAYDDAANSVTVTNPLGRQTVYRYARQNQVRRLVSIDGIAAADTPASVASHGYDTNGFRNRTTDAEGRVTSWTNNSRGLPTLIVEAAGTPEARTTAVTWDATRPLPTSIAAPGLTTTLDYDADGRITALTRADTTGANGSKGERRTTRYRYVEAAFTGAPTAEPTGPALEDAAAGPANGDAGQGLTGWTASKGLLATGTASPCGSEDPCFASGNAAMTLAHQDVAVPASLIGDVDAGLRAAEIAWRQRGTGGDAAAVNLFFLDQAGATIGAAPSPASAETTWTARRNRAPVPTGTRIIRVQMVMDRNAGSTNDAWIDDMTLTLAADGTAAAEPFLRIANPDALPGGLTGWTMRDGSLATKATAPCDLFACFAGTTRRSAAMSQDIVLPADRLAEIDAGTRGLDIAWLAWTGETSIRIGAMAEFLDAGGTPIAGRTLRSSLLPTGEAWARQHLRVGSLPSGTRAVRLRLAIANASYITKADAAFTGITARLVRRASPSGSVTVLGAIDGPLKGEADSVTYAYDGTAQVAAVTDATGLVTRIAERNGDGHPTLTIDPNGVATRLAYDARGRLVSVTVDPGPGQSVSTTRHDAAGLVTRLELPDGSWLAYEWDAARRLVSVSDATGARIDHAHNDNGDVTETVVRSAAGAVARRQQAAFDALGRLLSLIDADGRATAFGYDRTDALLRLTEPSGHARSFSHDGLKRLIRQVDGTGAGVSLTRDGQDNVTAYRDPRGLSTRFGFNGFGEALTESGPDVGATAITRDARGLAVTVRDARGSLSRFAYDAGGRPTRITYDADPSLNVTYGYDATAGDNRGAGRLTSVADGAGSGAWSYDALGRVVAETRVIGGRSYVTRYAHDAAGRVVRMVYPSGRIVSYARDAAGRVSAVTTRRHASAAERTVVSGVSWEPMADEVARLAFGNGLALAAVRDLDGRLASLTLRDGPRALSERSYAHGDGVNLTAIDDRLDPAKSVSLAYDGANRLSTASGPWGQLAYAYDATGNRLTETLTPPGGGAARVTRSLIDGTSNRLMGLETGGTTVRRLDHDRAGNRVSDRRADESFTYGYDARNRLASATRATGTARAVTRYRYTATEQMASRETLEADGRATTVHYIYDRDGHLIAEADGAAGTVLREYVWMAGSGPEPIDMPLALVVNADTARPLLLFVHADHLGRPERLTDAERDTLWEASYLPFGEARETSGTVEQNLRFPGQYFLIETGLAYNWHRHYDATTGRYTQPDPLRFVDGPNVYQYAGARPLVEVDREGRIAILIPAIPFIVEATSAALGFGIGALAGGAINEFVRCSGPGSPDWDKCFEKCEHLMGVGHGNEFRGCMKRCLGLGPWTPFQ